MLVLSIGENCMPQIVIKRFNIQNTWNTPYSSARTNIRYAIEYEKESYKTLLEERYITKLDDTKFSEFYRNIKYMNNIDTQFFDKSVSMGFEFTHHNIIENLQALESYKRKIQRMIDLRASDEDIVFLYHHRYLNNESLDKIIDYCNAFVDIYNHEKRKCHVVLMNQKIIERNERRKLEISSLENCVLCNFYTRDIWEGDASGFVTAEIDDDLFVEMFKTLYAMHIIDNIDFMHNYHMSIFYFLQNNFDDMYSTIVNNLKVDDGQSLYIWGAGAVGSFFAQKILERELPLNAIIDNDVNKQMNLGLPIPVLPFYAIEANSKIFISILNENIAEEIIQQIGAEYNEISITKINYESFEFFGVTILGK